MYNVFRIMAAQTQNIDLPNTQPFQPEKELFTWQSPARYFKKRTKQFWTTIVTIASLFSFIIFLAEGPMPVILIVAVIFLYYVLSNVEPEEIQYKITTRGIRVEDKLTEMEVISRFWFHKKLETNLLILEVLQIPGRLELVVNAKDLDKIRKVLFNYLPEEEAPPTNFDKFTSWFSEKLPS